MNKIRLDLNLLEVFCHVYEEGNFSRAAEKLSLSQSTVSGHIQNLERYIGARLFDRLPRRIVPTRVGQILYRRGRSILDEKEAALRELKNFLDCAEGPLTICGSTIPSEYLLPPIVARFHARRPAIRIELRISDSQTACNEVLSGSADLGFAGAKLDAVDLSFLHFATDELALVAPNNKEWRRITSISPEILMRKPFLAREVGSGTRMTFEKQSGLTLDDFNLIGSFSSTNAVKEAIRAGLGISVLSLLAVAGEIASGEFKTLQIEGIGKIRRDFFVVLNQKLSLSSIAAAFLDFALDDSSHATQATLIPNFR